MPRVCKGEEEGCQPMHYTIMHYTIMHYTIMHWLHSHWFAFASLCRRANARKMSALYSLWWPIYIFNLVDITKLPCYPHQRSTTVSLETFTLYSLYYKSYH